MRGFTDLPEKEARELGAFYVAYWGGDWFIMQVTGATDRSVSPVAGPFTSRPEIAIMVWAAEYPEDPPCA
jgi:hypothetical protein